MQKSRTSVVSAEKRFQSTDKRSLSKVSIGNAKLQVKKALLSPSSSNYHKRGNSTFNNSHIEDIPMFKSITSSAVKKAAVPLRKVEKTLNQAMGDIRQSRQSREKLQYRPQQSRPIVSNFIGSTI